MVGIRTGSLRRVCGGGGGYIMRRRCSRQRELANPVIREGRLNVKKNLHIRQLSLVGFEVFVTAFFPLFP